MHLQKTTPEVVVGRKMGPELAEAVTRQGRDAPNKAAMNNRLGKNPIIWQPEAAKVSDKFFSACQVKTLC